MKYLIKIFGLFALAASIASSAHALTLDETIQQWDRESAALDSCVAGIPKPASPSAGCQWWRSYEACHLDSYTIKRASGEKIIESESGDDCTIIPTEGGGPPMHYYYSGNQFCIEQGIGTSRQSKTCVQRTDIAQPTPIPKLEPSAGFQPLLEKSATQLEIEKNNAKKIVPPTKKVVTPKGEPAAPKPIEPGDPLYGSPTILRGGKVVPFAPGFNIAPGDVVETGDGIHAELISAGGAIYVRKGGTTVEFLGSRDNKVEPQSGPTVEDAKEELKSFLKSCSSRDYSACKEYTATVVMKGDVFFSEKMRGVIDQTVSTLTPFNERLPNGIVATLTAIMKHVGTEFGVTVAPDGATTVNTLEGSVLVMDTKSKQSVLVGANQSITIPKTTKGLTEAELQQRIIKIDPSSIDTWWERSIFEQMTSSLDPTKMIIILVVLGYVALMIMKRKQIWPNTYTATPVPKEGNSKILTDKYKWLVDNSFATGVFSTAICLYVLLAPRSSQFILLIKNYWLFFLAPTILGFIFGLLGTRSPRKAFVAIGMFFNIFAIMLWLKIGLMN